MKYSCVQEKMEKRKIKITSEILIEVSVEAPETKQFIEEHLEQKCLNENISVEEVISSYKPRSK